LILGLFTRIAAMIMLFTMAYISFFIGHGKVWYEDQHPFMFVLIALIYVVVGGGKWSLDRKFFD
jgi:putative oxidoreductase